MISSFRQHIERYQKISDEQFDAIKPYFELHSLKKKENIQEAGQAQLYNYFVLEGCLRIAQIILAIATINVWNRIAITSHTQPEL